MDALLGCEGHDAHPVVAEALPVARQHLGGGGEDVVEEGCGVDEVVEVDRVLLAPEDGRYTRRAAVLDEGDELGGGGLGPGELVLPGAAVAMPGRLDEEQVEAFGT